MGVQHYATPQCSRFTAIAQDKSIASTAANWAINNKTAIYVITVLLSIIGYAAYQNLPKENFPEVIIPKIFVQTIYPGTSPENMENLVTKQLEKQLKSTSGLKKITSKSYQDVSVITAEFNTNVDIKDAKQRVKDAVDKARQDLPNDLPKEPNVMDINLADLPIMYVNISGDFDLKKLKEYADVLKDRIEALKEISGVDIVGALDPEVQINADLNKMAAAQISFRDIESAVGYENLTISGGTVKMDGVRRTLNVKKEFKREMKDIFWSFKSVESALEHIVMTSLLGKSYEKQRQKIRPVIIKYGGFLVSKSL